MGSPQALAEELRQAASENKIDLELRQNAFLVSRKDPQGGWIQKPAKDYMAAEQIGVAQSGDGRFKTYVLSANPQHGLMQAVGDRIRPIRLHVRDSVTKKLLCGREPAAQDWTIEDYVDPEKKTADGMIRMGGIALREITCPECQAEAPKRWV
jgi:hypothetical protein